MEISGISKTPCPDCGGEVKWWHISSDCRGNDGINGTQCQKCKRAFTREESDDLRMEHTTKPEETKKVRIVLCSEIVLLRKPAYIDVYVENKLFARVTAKIEPQQGADGKDYPGITLAVTSESEPEHQISGLHGKSLGPMRRLIHHTVKNVEIIE